MFDLEREVATWTASVQAASCGNARRAAELADHLRCEIDRARAEGKSDEQAFAAAVAKIGPVDALVAEHAKNRSFFMRACAALARFDRREAAGVSRGPLLAHSFLWAGLLLATSMFLAKGSHRTESSVFIISVFVPTWWASELLLRGALRRARMHRER